MDSLGVLVVGCGSMGSSHARAYHSIDGFHVTGVVSRGAASRTALAAELGVPAYDSFERGIAVQRRRLARPPQADALHVADRGLRRALRRRDVPDDRSRTGARARHRRPPQRRDRRRHVQLRATPGAVRRRFGGLVRGRLGLPLPHISCRTRNETRCNPYLSRNSKAKAMATSPARRGGARRSPQRRPAALQDRSPATLTRQQRPSRSRPPNSRTARPRRPQPRRLALASLTRTVGCLLALIRHCSAVSPFRTRDALGTEHHHPHSAPSTMQPTSAGGAQTQHHGRLSRLLGWLGRSARQGETHRGGSVLRVRHETTAWALKTTG